MDYAIRLSLVTSAAVLLLAPLTALQAATGTWAQQMPVYDHVVIVLEENKNYEQVIGNKAAPYINGTLKAEGADLTKMYGEEHFSEGNYFWLLSGSNQNIGFVDAIPSRKTNRDYPFLAPNLAEQLIKHGLSFKGYSEDLPAIGDPVERKKHYARKHVPWVSFGNIPNGKTLDNSSHLRFADFPETYDRLPTVSMVIPNLIHDMHDGRPPKSVADGDAWLKKHVDGYYQWAKNHNSLLIVTFDENDDTTLYAGPTNPTSSDKVIQNRIPTIIAGAHVKHGEYPEGSGVTHVNILRTMEAMYKLNKCGAQLPSALIAGIADETVLTDIFDPIP
jgi:phosphatidylinositol-3-phosphatase